MGRPASDQSPPSYQARPAARAIVLNAAQQILLHRPNDLPIWAIPGGKIEDGELPVQAAVRETREETGYEIAIEGFAGEYWQPQIPRSSTTFLYLGRVTGGQPIARGPETRAVRWFSLHALPWRLPGLHRHLIRVALSRPAAPRRQAIYLSVPEAVLTNLFRSLRRRAQGRR